MPTDLDRLIQDFHDYFVDLYRQEPAPAGGEAGPMPTAFLATEPIGKSLTEPMFVLETGDFSPTLAREQFSYLANTIPVLAGSSILADSISSLDGLYELVLGSAQPLPGSDPGPFELFKKAALGAFDRALEHPLVHDGRDHRPALATPPDWCKPGATEGWTTKTFSQKASIESGTAISRPPSGPPPAHWSWQVAPADLQPALDSPKAVQRVMLQRRAFAAPGSSELPVRSAAIVRPVAATRLAVAQPMAATRFTATEAITAAAVRQPIAATTVAAAAPRPVMLMRAQVLAAQTRELAAASAKQEVTSTELSLSFDYCLVRAARPWLSTPLLNMKTWFMPGTRAGEIASGTGTSNAPLEVMPMAAIVVRNLKIAAKWSQQETLAVRTFTNLGPFSLVGRTFDEVAGALTCPGMQIVGWICEPTMKLPPAGDPALPI